MPNIFVKIPAGVFDRAARQRLLDGVNAVAARAERIPDDPKKRFLCWIIIEEVDAGYWICGGADVTTSIIPVMVVVNVPSGVLDDGARALYVRGIHDAVSVALSDERRCIASSCILQEITDGAWGANGAIWRLPDFAEKAGFEHLQHLVASVPETQVGS